MENNKSPGNDGLTKEFYITFWNEVKIPLLLAIEKASLVKEVKHFARCLLLFGPSYVMKV